MQAHLPILPPELPPEHSEMTFGSTVKSAKCSDTESGCCCFHADGMSIARHKATDTASQLCCLLEREAVPIALMVAASSGSGIPSRALLAYAQSCNFNFLRSIC